MISGCRDAKESAGSAGSLPIWVVPVKIGCDVAQRQLTSGRDGSEIPKNIAQLLNDSAGIADVGRLIALLFLHLAQKATGLAKQAEERKAQRSAVAALVGRQGSVWRSPGPSERRDSSVMMAAYLSSREIATGGNNTLLACWAPKQKPGWPISAVRIPRPEPLAIPDGVKVLRNFCSGERAGLL